MAPCEVLIDLDVSRQAILLIAMLLTYLPWQIQGIPTAVMHPSRMPNWFTEEGSIAFHRTDAGFEESFSREMDMRSNLIQQRVFPMPDPPENDGQGVNIADINTYDKFHYEMVPRVSHHKRRNYRMDCGSRFGYNYCSE